MAVVEEIQPHLLGSSPETAAPKSPASGGQKSPAPWESFPLSSGYNQPTPVIPQSPSRPTPVSATPVAHAPVTPAKPPVAGAAVKSYPVLPTPTAGKEIAPSSYQIQAPAPVGPAVISKGNVLTRVQGTEYYKGKPTGNQSPNIVQVPGSKPAGEQVKGGGATIGAPSSTLTLKEVAQKPLITAEDVDNYLPMLKDVPYAGDFAKGALKAATGFTSPYNLGIMAIIAGTGGAAAAVAPDVIGMEAATSALNSGLSAYFATEAGRGLAKKYPELRSAVESNDWRKVAEIGGEGVVEAGVIYGAGKHALDEAMNVYPEIAKARQQFNAKYGPAKEVKGEVLGRIDPFQGTRQIKGRTEPVTYEATSNPVRAELPPAPAPKATTRPPLWAKARAEATAATAPPPAAEAPVAPVTPEAPPAPAPQPAASQQAQPVTPQPGALDFNAPTPEAGGTWQTPEPTIGQIPIPLTPATEQESAPTPEAVEPKASTPKATKEQSAALESQPVGQAPETGGQVITPAHESVRPTAMATEVMTPKQTVAKVQYAIVPAGSVNTSFREGYNQEFQPRDIDRAASTMRVAKRKGDMKYLAMSHSGMAGDGAPIVAPNASTGKLDHVTRNHGGEALLQLYEEKSPLAEQYRQDLINKGSRFAGMTPEEVAAIPNPVMVRVLDEPDWDESKIREFAKEANTPSVAVLSEAEEANLLGQSLTKAAMAQYDPTEEGEPNVEFVRELIKGLTVEQQADYINKQGKLTSKGKEKAAHAIFARAYPDSAAIERMTGDTTTPGVRNITRGMLRAAPYVALLENAIQNGEVYDLGIAQQITDAATVIENAIKTKTPISDWLEATQLHGERDPFLDLLVGVLSAEKKRPRVISDTISNYARAVEKAGDPRQEGIFGPQPAPDKLQLLREAYDAAKREAQSIAERDAERAAEEERLLAAGRGSNAEASSEVRQGDSGEESEKGSIPIENPAPGDQGLTVSEQKASTTGSTPSQESFITREDEEASAKADQLDKDRLLKSQLEAGFKSPISAVENAATSRVKPSSPISG